MKEALIQVIEDLFQVVITALRGDDAFSAARATNLLGTFGDRGAAQMPAIAIGVGRLNRLAIELGQQDVRDGSQHAFRCAFENVRQANQRVAIAETDGGVDAGEPIEANVEDRHGRAWTQSAILSRKNLSQAARNGRLRDPLVRENRQECLVGDGQL